MRLLHIAAGLTGLLAGAVALFALKGATLHRRSGTIFVYAMLVMSVLGAVMAALKPQRISVVAGALTAYLVTTSLLTVRRRAPGSRQIDVAAMLFGLAVCVLGARFGFEALNGAGGKLDGLPAAPAFMFASVALLATAGDLRMILAGGLEGAGRLARHLWRMCFALFIAAASFFLGQPRVFPKALRDSGLLPLPVLLIVMTMLFWLVRVRFTSRRLPGKRQVPEGQAAGPAIVRAP